MNKLIIDLLGLYTTDTKFEETENVTAIHIYRWNNIDLNNDTITTEDYDPDY